MAQSPDSLNLGLLRIRHRKGARLVKTEEQALKQPTDDEFIALWAEVFPQEPVLDFTIRSGVIVKKLVSVF